MRLTPVLTEKSLQDAKEGKYTFLVDKRLTKGEISRLVESSFAVNVSSVRTANIKGGEKKNVKGRIQTKKAYKKAWVGLKDKGKIELFEEKTK